MEFKDALSMFFERSNSMQTYWSFYVTIVLAYVAFFGGVKPSRKTTYTAVLLTVAFVMFAVVNLDGLLDVTRQRIVFRELLTTKSTLLTSQPDQAVVANLAKVLTPPPVGSVVVVHVVGDVLTLVAIWLPLVRRTPRDSLSS